MICPKCKKVYNNIDDIFCSDCGTKLVSNPIERLSMRAKSNTNSKGDFETIVRQNELMIKQNEIIIGLLERLV